MQSAPDFTGKRMIEIVTYSKNKKGETVQPPRPSSPKIGVGEFEEGRSSDDEPAYDDESAHKYDEEMEVFCSDDDHPQATQEPFDPDEVIPLTQQENSPSLPDLAYLEAFKKGYLALSSLIWKEEEAAKRPALREVSSGEWDDVVLEILATMPLSLVREIISSNIAREYYKGKRNVYEVLRHNKKYLESYL
ncbi:hypothetical protein W97_08888 [Coniosporium apollinis CBS 100218]|uniref:Uncharacterized protein n=1 Tax=Coniosporium apollinis (strain CBS 100218) TaxID=1168221 RepID=R7Z6B0_CONA1|nr:uncharacterized protein W97_08888 [Coniosporium apollinis CBS 100218]EON69628.1 hypothetical protein W97_08888 [Coniosporium apollinis CBS 100218]